MTGTFEIIIGKDLITDAPTATVAQVLADMKEGHLDEVYIQINLFSDHGPGGVVCKDAEYPWQYARVGYGYGRTCHRLPRTSRRSC